MLGLWSVIGLCLLGVLSMAYVLWHARARLKLTKRAVEETEFPHSSGGP